jgi:hypothetical protein
MSEGLHIAAQQIGNEIIDLSAILDHKMEKWSDTAMRPNDLSPTECAGFINKGTATDGLNIVVDLQAPSDGKQAVLRTWAIETKPDSSNVERFNNIQLNFAVNYDLARSVTQKGSEITRGDLRTLINRESTNLTRIVVGDQTGADKVTGKLLGQRYDLDTSELNQQDETGDEIDVVLQAVLSKLQDSAKHEI